ncbi:uncharacterized protein EI90DRAFT_3062089 [Cantharellus anzutake]|uniref:uncharacterized protein n=1 Tax=Cantharellus anzutake TaxID=1750568 RepID=UPI0019057CA0|nr:uncharacterized protein EI90DRAFT_3062089 [Cantharellus anzutake]KAF8329812.1 hypothetical protein EI90DRAFT_3062089 [Cantharellus anzutake]
MFPKGGPRDDPTRLQSGLRGNKLPRPVEILASVISVTYVGVGNVPQHMLKSTFRIRRKAVLAALQWLMKHNKCFSEYTMDEAVLNSLPEDDVPLEIKAAIRQETEISALLKEHDSYVPGNGVFLPAFKHSKLTFLQ